MTAPKKGPWRDRWGHFVKRALYRKPCPHPSCKVRTMTEGQLEDHLRSGHGYSEVMVTAAIRELSRREDSALADKRRAQKRKSDAQSRAMEHEEALEAAYLQAEHRTRGHMLNAAGRKARVDPRSLWTGPESRVRKYASEELKAYFDQHGRLTRQEFDRHSRRRREEMGYPGGY